MWRMREVLLVLVSGLALGCGDLTSSQINPEPKTRPNMSIVTVDGREYMSFESVDEARASVGWAAIYDHDTHVFWRGAAADYASILDYYGNRALISGTLTFSGGTESMAPLKVEEGRNNLFDMRQQLYITQSAQAPNTCGLSATLSLSYLAATEVYIPGYGPYEPGRVIKHGNSSAYQPKCTCSDGGGGGDPIRENVSSASYDPYADATSDNAGSDCDDGGGTSEGGSNPGSGTQFGEGDYTGGETVDWGTGVGNGGSSECGAAAQVRYVCIDIYIDGAWRQWSCGWATTC